MKKMLFTASFLTLGFLFTAYADKAGPSGGKLLTKVQPNAEFFVTKNRLIEIRFVDAANKVVPPGEQVVNVIMGDRSSPTKLNFTKQGDKVVSNQPIPEGHGHPTVVQIRANADQEPVSERFNLNLGACSSCKYEEYACICGHRDEGKN
jgi:hypothetical protein